MTPARTAVSASCPVCGDDQGAILSEYHEPDRYERAVGVSAQDYLRRWLRCRTCDLHYAVSTQQEALETLYGTAYRQEQVQGIPLRERFETVVSLPYDRSENKQRVAGLRRLLSDVQPLVPRAPGRRRVLDVGGGTGVFLHEFVDAEWEGYVVEPTPAACEFIRERFPGLRVAQGYFSPGQFGCRFHLVTLIQTLEHVEDPLAVLAGVREELEPNGLAFVESPDALNFRLFPPDHDIFASPHRFLFDPGSLATLARRAGLRPLVVVRQRAVRGHVNVICLAGRDDVAVAAERGC